MFNDLVSTTSGSISLVASSTTTSSSPPTAPIPVTPSTPSLLVIQTQPSQTATAGQAFGTQPVVYEEDQYGNLETSDNTTVVTAYLSTGSGSLTGTVTATVSGGIATFTNLGERHGRDDHAVVRRERPDVDGKRPDRRQSRCGQQAGDHPRAVDDGDRSTRRLPRSQLSKRRTSTATSKRATTAPC